MDLYPTESISKFIIQLENLKHNFHLELSPFLHFQKYQQAITPIHSLVDSVNDEANELQNLNVVLSHTNVHKLEDYNTRYVQILFLF